MKNAYGLIRGKAYICVHHHDGPWHGGGRNNDHRACAQELSENKDLDDAELMRRWPRIDEDLNIPIEDQNREGRRKFLARLPDMDCVRTKGGHASAKQREEFAASLAGD